MYGLSSSFSLNVCFKNSGVMSKYPAADHRWKLGQWLSQSWWLRVCVFLSLGNISWFCIRFGFCACVTFLLLVIIFYFTVQCFLVCCESCLCFIPPVTVSSSRVLSASTYLSCFLFHFDSPCPVCFCFPFVSLCQICPSCVPICSPSSVCCYVFHFCCAFLVSFMFSSYIM